MEKRFIVFETVPVMAFRTIEGAEDYVQHMEHVNEGIYEIVDSKEETKQPQPVYGNSEVH